MEERITRLENLLYAFIKSQSSKDQYKMWDIDGCRHTDGEQQVEIDDTKETIDLSLGVTEHNVEDRNYIAQQTARLNQITLGSIELSEEQMLEIPDLYPLWVTMTQYTVGTIVKWGWDEANGRSALWKCVQAHTSQDDWTPDKTASLWSRIGFTPSGYEEWHQPLGGHDAYKKGDIVSYNDKLYQSTVDGNVWSPEVYGWVEYKEK